MRLPYLSTNLAFVLLAAGCLSGGRAGAQTPGARRAPIDLARLKASAHVWQAGLRIGRGEYAEAAKLLHQAAPLSGDSTLFEAAAWRYFDAGDFRAMFQAATSGQSAATNSNVDRPTLKVARQLNENGTLDWNPIRAAIRGTPTPTAEQLVPLQSPEGQVAIAYLALRDATQIGRARRRLEKTISAQPGLSEAHLLLAQLLRDHHFFAEAAPYRLSSLRLDPDASTNALYRAWQLRAEGQGEEADRRFRQAIASADLTVSLEELFHLNEAREPTADLVAAAMVDDANRAEPRLQDHLTEVVELFHRHRRYPALVRMLASIQQARPQDFKAVCSLIAAHVLNGTPQRATGLVRRFPELGFYTALAAGVVALARECPAPSASPFPLL